MDNLLFVYGSLLSTGNYFANYLAQNAELITTGKFKGILYDIGEYPGAVLAEENAFPVYGSIYKLLRPQKSLEILDEYEGVGDTQEQPNLFTRKLLSIETDANPLNCWVYLYNLPTDNLAVIHSGKYQQYLKSKA